MFPFRVRVENSWLSLNLCFRSGLNDLVVVNDIILAELIPYISHVGKFDVVDALETIDKLKLNINWSEIISFQKMNLKNGVNKVGIPDLIILQ